MLTLEELYRAIGGDYVDLLQRIPSETMVRRFVLKYPNDPTYNQLCTAVDQKDWNSAFRAAHTLKGVAQNLGFHRLYLASNALTEALRGGVPLTQWDLLDAVTAEHITLLANIADIE